MSNPRETIVLRAALRRAQPGEMLARKIATLYAIYGLSAALNLLQGATDARQNDTRANQTGAAQE